MNITIKHQILKALRSTRTIPLEAMASKLGISLDEYKKYESADIEVDLEFANKIAAVFKRNWSVFLLNSLPKDPIIKRDNRTTENQTPSLHEKTINAIEDANYIFQFAQGLSTHSGLKIPKFDDIKDLDAEELGDRVRKVSNISIEDQMEFGDNSSAFKKWLHFVENLGIFVSQYPLEVEDKIRAFSISDHDRAIIVLNTNDSVASRIFSLLHELCHILRRNSGVCDLHYSLDSDVEVYCNKFASAFLVSDSFIKNYIVENGRNKISSDINYHVGSLSRRFKVSQLVIYRKFTTFGIISDQEYSEIHNSITKNFPIIRKEAQDEITGGPNYYTIRKLRNGKAYSNIVLESLHLGEITAFEASNALGVNRNKLNEYRNRTA